MNDAYVTKFAKQILAQSENITVGFKFRWGNRDWEVIDSKGGVLKLKGLESPVPMQTTVKWMTLSEWIYDGRAKPIKTAASFPGRAWQGKTELIGELLSEAYQHMSEYDKNLKDTVFNAYYRHYNDGDFKSLPYKTLQRLGMTEQDLELLKEGKSYKDSKLFQPAIEKAVDVVSKYLLKKYKSKVNRKQFNYKKLDEIARAIKQGDYKDEYWINKFGEMVGNNELIEIAKKLKELNKGISLVKDLKDLSDEDVVKIRRIVREELEKRKVEEVA